MTSRYCYCPCTAKKIGRRVTLRTRLKRYFKRRREEPDIFPVVGYFQPVYPTRK